MLQNERPGPLSLLPRTSRGGQRPEREVSGIAVILQVEDARKARCRKPGVGPVAARRLGAGQVVRATAHRRAVATSRRNQSQHGPSGLEGARAASGASQRRVVVGLVAFTPAAVIVL